MLAIAVTFKVNASAQNRNVRHRAREEQAAIRSGVMAGAEAVEIDRR